ncbi:MAG: hypothetical protein ACXWQO_07065 [Bdellovibrionota bacterium]
MKLILMLALFLIGQGASADDSLVGHWGYFMKIYKGQEIPEGPDATLRLRYELEADGSSHLFWWHVGEHDHCQRKGHYHTEENLLVDHTEWVDPENTETCSQDPDMQADKTTKTPFSFKDGNLLTRIQLGEEELFYVWKIVNE